MTDSPTPLDPRASVLLNNIPGVHMQLLYAFQALGLPKGVCLTRGFTRTMAAQIINGFMGIKSVTRSSRPPAPPADQALEHYVTWALSEAERRHKTTLDIVVVVPA